MNETYRHQAEAAATRAITETLPAAWGFWSTTAWALLAFLLGGGIVGTGVLWLSWNQPEPFPDPQEDPWFPLQFIIINVVQMAVLAGAARWARWPVSRYLGLVRPRRRDLVFGIVALALMMGGLEIVTHLLGRQSVTPFQTDSYRAARAAGLLSLMWLAFVIVAPIGEEIVFRGFVFRGWAASPLGVPGTILLTSLIFSAAHTQYDWFGAFQTLCIGALFGWLRWRSGSTILTILLHMAINFVSTTWTAMKVEGIV
jgi:membrane protease YdiL (CAAX protease family)